jgi:hypothetical protein
LGLQEVWKLPKITLMLFQLENAPSICSRVLIFLKILGGSEVYVRILILAGAVTPAIFLYNALIIVHLNGGC